LPVVKRVSQVKAEQGSCKVSFRSLPSMFRSMSRSLASLFIVFCVLASVSLSAQILPLDIPPNRLFYSSTKLSLPSNIITGYIFHTQPNLADWRGIDEQGRLVPGIDANKPSNEDYIVANMYRNMNHFMGWDGGLVRYNGFRDVWNLAGENWWNIPCDLDNNNVNRGLR